MSDEQYRGPGPFERTFEFIWGSSHPFPGLANTFRLTCWAVVLGGLIHLYGALDAVAGVLGFEATHLACVAVEITVRRRWF